MTKTKVTVVTVLSIMEGRGPNDVDGVHVFSGVQDHNKAMARVRTILVDTLVKEQEGWTRKEAREAVEQDYELACFTTDLHWSLKS